MPDTSSSLSIINDGGTIERLGPLDWKVTFGAPSIRDYIFDYREWLVHLGAEEHTCQHVCPPDAAAADDRLGRLFRYPNDPPEAARVLAIGSVAGWSQVALVALVAVHELAARALTEPPPVGPRDDGDKKPQSVDGKASDILINSSPAHLLELLRRAQVGRNEAAAEALRHETRLALAEIAIFTAQQEGRAPIWPPASSAT